MTRKEFEEIECLRVGSRASRLNFLSFKHEDAEEAEGLTRLAAALNFARYGLDDGNEWLALLPFFQLAPV